MDNLHIATFNVKGLKKDSKRKKLFRWCHKKKFDIICLQEAHCEATTINDWKEEWKGDIVASYGTHNKKGTCILLREGLDFEITSHETHGTGRYVAINGVFKNSQYKIASYYGPNQDDPTVLLELIEIIRNMEGENTILCGDFNLVMDLQMDKKGGNQTTHFKCRSALKEWMEEENLYEIWRVKHPSAKTFTWRSNTKPFIFCRLDFFITSAKVLNDCTECEIGPGLNSDHSYVRLNIANNNVKRGRGFWKFSKLLLENNQFEDRILNVINQTAIDNHGCSDTLMWDTIKSAIRGECISFSSRLKKDEKCALVRLEKELAELQNELLLESDSNRIDNQELQDIMYNIQCKSDVINELLDRECRGAMLRSKLQQYEQGDKPTKFFLGLEKSRAANKTINKLVTDNGSVITDHKKILKEQSNFYKKLYRSSLKQDPDSKENRELELEKLFNNPSPKVNCEQKRELVNPITENEIWNIIKNSPKNKSPGTDGLTNEFYQKFWPHIKNYVMKAYNNALDTGQLSINQKQGIISVIPKGNKDITKLKNWRPITLLNQDYKYLAKCLADRCKHILPTIIHNDQSGFVPGRVIGSNILRVQDIINLCKERNIDALLMCIDYEKAFDSIEWCFVFRAMQYFGFPDQYIKWIKIFYNDIKTCTVNNGNISDFFCPERGVRQGCPLSPILFVISVELLALEIRNNVQISGVMGKLSEHKISQFADDTTFFLKNSSKSVNELFRTLSRFTLVSGLKLNQDKTEVLPLGNVNINTVPCSVKQFVKDRLKLLGVTIMKEKKDVIEVNYNPIIDKMNSLMLLWKRRKLSLLGKICILKSLIISKLVYSVICLPNPGGTKLEEIQNLMYNFIWDGKIERIPRKVLIGNYDDGGYKMPDIASQANALKGAWIKNLVKMSGQWRDYICGLLPLNCPSYFSRCNLKYTDIPNKPTTESIWSDILINWCCYNYIKPENIIIKPDILNQNLWWNSAIKIQSKVVYLQKWADKNILYISDLCDEDGKLLDYQNFCTKFDMSTPFTTFFGIISAIPRHWRRLLYLADNYEDIEQEDENPLLIDNLDSCKRASNFLYNITIQSKRTKPTIILERWKEELGVDICEKTWLRSVANLRFYSNSSKVKSYLYKFHLRNISYGKRLFHMGRAIDNKCKWCPNQVESILHLYWQCPKSVELWQSIATLFSDIYNIQEDVYNLDVLTYLFGIFPANNKYPRVFNVITALTRHFIHLEKCNEKGTRSIRKLEIYIKDTMVTEWQIAKKIGKIDKFLNKWDLLYEDNQG